MLQIARSVEALRVPLRITRHADAEIVPLAHEFDQLIRIHESALRSDELTLPCRWIATQGQDILDPCIPKIIKDFPDLLGRMTDAREMRHRADVQFVLNALDQADGL